MTPQAQQTVSAPDPAAAVAALPHPQGMVLDQLAGVGLLANLLRDPAHPSVPLGTPSMAHMHQHERVGVAHAGHHHTCEPDAYSGS